MKELGITKEQAKEWFADHLEYSFDDFVHVSTWGDYGGEAHDSPFGQVLADFANEKNSKLLQRYNEAIEVLENVKRLETLIRYPDDVSIMHEGEAKAIHMMLNDVEQTISKAKGE